MSELGVKTDSELMIELETIRRLNPRNEGVLVTYLISNIPELPRTLARQIVEGKVQLIGDTKAGFSFKRIAKF